MHAEAQLSIAQRFRIAKAKSRRLLEKFDEAQHPRDDHGKFTDGGGGDAPSGSGDSIKTAIGKDLDHPNLTGLKEAVDRGAWNLTIDKVKTYGSQKTTEIGISPRIPSDWLSHTNPTGSVRSYAPGKAKVDEDGYLVPTVKDTEAAIPKVATPGVIYRGMSYEEYQSALKNGNFASMGGYNLGDEQKGLTYYSSEPAQAVNYAHSYAPWAFKAVPGRPAVVVGVADPGGHIVNPQQPTELGINKPVPTSAIREVYLGEPIISQPGYVEVIQENGRPPMEGSRNSPSITVEWRKQSEPADLKIVPPPQKAAWGKDVGKALDWENQVLQHLAREAAWFDARDEAKRLLGKYSDDEPRDSDGRWSGGGGDDSDAGGKDEDEDKARFNSRKDFLSDEAWNSSWELQNKIYGMLIDAADSGPYDGGCVIMAQALQKIVGGNVVGLTSANGRVQHAVVKTGDTYHDYSGSGSLKAVMDHLNKLESLDPAHEVVAARPMRKDDLPGAPRNNKVASEIAALIKKNKAYDPSEPRDDGGKWTSGGGDTPEEAEKFQSEKLITDGPREGTSRVRVVKDPNIGIWGGSHSGSSAITGHSATVMGIGGYESDGVSKQESNLGNKFLDVIAKGQGAGEKLYHGFSNSKGIVWKEGDTIRLPLTATSGDIDTSTSYGVNYSREDNSGATVFEFPARTAMAGYARWDRNSTKDLGHTWSEAIVAGEFKVAGIGTRTEQGFKQLPVRVVTLEPTALFDRASGKWISKSAEADLSTLVGQCENHQFPTHPSSADPVKDKAWQQARDQAQRLLHKYDPSEPRDDSGKWTSGGGSDSDSKPSGGGKSKKPAKKEDFDKAGIGIRVTGGGAKGEQEFIDKWNDKVGMEPEEFKKSFLGNVPASMNISGYSNGTKFNVRGGIKGTGSLEGHEIGTYEREVDLDAKSAYSAYFKLEKTATKHDIGKKVLAGNVATYKQIGIEKVKVTANIDVGGYAWAKYGYVPTQDSWNSLRGDLEKKLTGGGGSTSSRRNPNAEEADDWDQLSSDRQDDVRDEWMRSTRQEFISSEEQNWRESGQALDDAKSDTAFNYQAYPDSIPEWVNTALERARTKQQDAGGKEIPFTNKQLYDAIELTYENDGEGGNDPEITFDDKALHDALADPNQQTLPGIEPPDLSKLLDRGMRGEIDTMLTFAFNEKAQEAADEMDPPSYLADNVEEYQDDSWSGMRDRDRLDFAQRNNMADIEIEPDEEEPQAEMELPKTDVDPVLAAVRSSDPKSIWKVADSPQGKSLLLGTGWSGVLNLKDKDQMDRFNKYVGKAA